MFKKTADLAEVGSPYWRNSSTWLLLLQQLATPLYLLSLVTTVKLDTIRLCWAESVFSTVKKKLRLDWTGLLFRIVWAQFSNRRSIWAWLAGLGRARLVKNLQSCSMKKWFSNLK